MAKDKKDIKKDILNVKQSIMVHQNTCEVKWMKVSNAFKTQVPIIEKAMQGLPAIAFDVSL